MLSESKVDDDKGHFNESKDFEEFERFNEEDCRMNEGVFIL